MDRYDLGVIDSGNINWEMYRKKSVLITGATGRLGHYITETLIDVDFHYNLDMRIYIVARNIDKIKKIYSESIDLPNLIVICQDINQPIVVDDDIDYIFHTAGPAAPMDFKNQAVETAWAHVNGTRNVLELARTHNTKKVFYISTVEVYGELKTDNPITEESMGVLQHNISRACYPEAKRMCETLLASYEDEYGIEYTGVRLCHTLGPGIILDDGRAFAEFIKKAIDGEDIILHSDGSAMRTYTYTPDAVNAMFIVMERGKSGMLYNVASNENLISIRDLAELIASLSPHSTKVVFDEAAAHLPYLPFKLAIMDTSAVRALGWSPKTNIKETFKRTIESFD